MSEKYQNIRGHCTGGKYQGSKYQVKFKISRAENIKQITPQGLLRKFQGYIIS